MAGEQKPSCNLLEQFILLAKGTSGSALTALISQVLEAPGVYVFGELLELTNVQEVSAEGCLNCSLPGPEDPVVPVMWCQSSAHYSSQEMPCVGLL